MRKAATPAAQMKFATIKKYAKRKHIVVETAHCLTKVTHRGQIFDR